MALLNGNAKQKLEMHFNPIGNSLNNLKLETVREAETVRMETALRSRRKKQKLNK